MAIRVQRHANVSKQATLLDGLDVSPLNWRVYGCGLNRFVYEGLNDISNVKVHLYLYFHCESFKDKKDSQSKCKYLFMFRVLSWFLV